MPTNPPSKRRIHVSVRSRKTSKATGARRCLQGRWRAGKKLGSGSWGAAFVVTRIPGSDAPKLGERGAVLKVTRLRLDPEDRAMARYGAERDAFFLEMLNDTGMVPRFYDAWVCDGSAYMVLERWPMDLGTYMHRTKGVVPEWVLMQMHGIALMLGEAGIVHGDAKPDNWLIDPAAYEVVINDFGYATDYREWRLDAPKHWGWLYAHHRCRFTKDPELVKYFTLFDTELGLIEFGARHENGAPFTGWKTIDPKMRRRLNALCRLPSRLARIG